MPLQGVVEIYGQDIYDNSSSQEHRVGTLGASQDGRFFRYVKVGGSGITAGQLQVAPAPKTNHHNVAASVAAAVDDKTITVTLGATAAVAAEYAEGLIIASDVAPEGSSYIVSNHPAADASATLELKLDEPIKEAITTTSEFCLVHNTWMKVGTTTDEERVPAGVPLVDMTTLYFGWLQTKGPCPVLCDDGTATVNYPCVADDAQAGAVVAQNVEYDAGMLQRVVGYFLVAGVDTEYRPVMLTID